MTAEFDITVFFPPPPHLDPRGPIKFELVITWDVITAISPYISNKTQRNTTSERGKIWWPHLKYDFKKVEEICWIGRSSNGHYGLWHPCSIPPSYALCRWSKSLKFTFFYFFKLSYTWTKKSLLYYRYLKLSHGRWCFSSKFWTRRKFTYRFEIGEVNGD